ncbi:hypothetical protein GCM10029964_022950 [Kibdelosporangium lantanae]
MVVPPRPDDVDRTCEIGGGSAGGTLEVTLLLDSSPLPAAYATTPDKYEFFRAIQVAGFPAVELGVTEVAPIACEVSVGTGDQQGFTLHQGPGISGSAEEACGRLAVAAQAVMRRLGA